MKLRNVKTNTGYKRKEVMCELKHELTIEEQRMKGHLLAEQQDQLAKKEGEKTLFNQNIKKEIDTIAKAMDQNAQELRQGWELRQIPCEALYDYATGRVSITRVDTQELVDERAMTIDERQTSFFVEEVVH